MFSLEGGDSSFYCQDAFNRIISAGIPPSLDMYKAVLKALAKDEYYSNSKKNIDDFSFSLESGTSSGGSPADRAVTLFQHMVSVGSFSPDLECFELLVKAFERTSLSLKSSSSRLTQTYPSRALEVAEHMLEQVYMYVCMYLCMYLCMYM
jgi:hypothetical protein